MSKDTHDQHAATIREVNYDKLWFFAAKDALRNIISPHSTILDFCCGNGEFSEILKKEFLSEVVCLDYADSHLGRVRELGFETIACDIEDVQQRDRVAEKHANRFDAVVMLECIEHFFMPDEALAFVNKLLKPGGYLLATTPNMANLSYRLYSMFCGNLPAGMGHHVYFFDIRRLRQLLLLNAFDVESVNYFGGTGYYLDRAFAYPKSFAKQLLLKSLWKIGKIFGGKPLNCSELIVVAQKNTTAKPLGLEASVRGKTYTEMEMHERAEAISRLSISYQRGMFAEHPGLCKFLEQELNSLESRKRLPYFSSKGIEITTHFFNGQADIFPAIEPLVDEKCAFTGIIGVMTKGGILRQETIEFIQKHRKDFIYIWLASAGPYFYNNFEQIFAEYDAVTALDCTLPIEGFAHKLLRLNYPMFTRCGPLPDGFFWIPAKRWDADFSILTWYGNTEAKQWPHAKRITGELCARGFKGILVTQRGEAADMLDDEFRRHVDAGLLELHTGDLPEQNFHALMARARFGIFPNEQDALPKHIIECLLADKPVAISKNLLFGRDTLAELGNDCTLVVDFSATSAVDEIVAFMRAPRAAGFSPRQLWLERYNFYALSRSWAQEINRLFGTGYERIFCMRHIDRYINSPHMQRYFPGAEV